MKTLEQKIKADPEWLEILKAPFNMSEENKHDDLV